MAKLSTEHLVYYSPGGLADLHSGCNDLQMQNLNLTQNQVDTILRELKEAGFSGNANLGGNNAAPSAWGLEMKAAIEAEHSNTITVSS